MFLVIKRYIVDAEEKKGAKLSFYAISLFRIYLFEIKCLLVPLPPIGQLQFLRATVSSWMKNATLNYRKNNDAKLLLVKKVRLRCLRRVEVCGKESIYSVTRECLIGETLKCSNYSCLTSMGATPLCF